MIRAVTCGEALVLMQPRERGPLDAVRDYTLRVAGAELNVAIGLARLGIPTAFLGATGDDPFGRLIGKTLAGEGVDVSGLLRLDAPTGLFFKEWYGIGDDPSVYYYRHGSAGSRWTYQPTPESHLDQVEWVHTSGITLMVGHESRESALRVVKNLARQNALASFDINLRRKLGAPEKWRIAVEPWLPLWSVVFATEDEIAQVWGLHEADALFTTGLLSSRQTLIVKRGGRGAWAIVNGERIDVPGVAVSTLADPVGAGDGFAAGVIAARLKGLSWSQALAIGNLVGAFAVAHPGDYEGYPTWAIVERAGTDWITR